MPTPPPLSAEQRRAAYEKALELRRERAILKTRISSDWWKGGIREAWQEEAAQGMKVLDLLMALPNVGPKRARAMLEKAGIPERNTVRACGPRQTEKLFAQLK